MNAGGRSWSRLAVPGVVLIVAVSAVARFAASRSLEAPWIAPDEMIYGLLGRSIWATGHGTLIGSTGHFYGGYPLLVGLPLHVLPTATAITTIQLGQALLMSLTAAIVWAWARPVVGDGWALAAAALTACLPALAYSGLLMSEAAFLPATMLALWCAARAFVQPTWGRQAALVGALGLASAARLQGAILVPVVVTAALLTAWFSRDRRLVGRLAPTWLTLAALGVLWALFQVGTHGNLTDAFGAYGNTITTAYDVGGAARWVLRHAGDLFLLVLGVPLVATGVLAYGAARGRESDPGVRALVALSISTALWLTLQVGVFASRYVGQLAERDLIAAAPPLFACLAVWLSRGLPRPQPATSIIAFTVAVPAVLLPVRALATPYAAPDAFMMVPLVRLQEATSARALEASWLIAATALVAIAVLMPRRLAPLLPVLVALGLAATSVVSSSEITKLARSDDDRIFGTAKRTWVDDAATGPVLYLYDRTTYWNAVWKLAFWNDRIARVARLPGSEVESVPTFLATPRYDGVLFGGDGRLLRDREIVAPTTFTFFGEPEAEIAQVGLDQAGLRLWRTTDIPRLSTWTNGLKPDGDIVQPVRMYVYDCDRGSLQLTLLGKQGTPIEIDLDGALVRRIDLAPGKIWSGSIPVPVRAHGGGRCTFEIRSSGLVGSTRIAFVREGASSASS